MEKRIKKGTWKNEEKEKRWRKETRKEKEKEINTRKIINNRTWQGGKEQKYGKTKQ